MQHRFSSPARAGLFDRLAGAARLTFVLFLSVVSASPAIGAAPTVDERSPLSQGAWWYPARSGSGFEIFTVGEQVAVLWYTYTTDGKPIWYLAQGSRAEAGTVDWPLRQHSWVNGAAGPATDIGTLKLNILHPEAAEITWRIGNDKGTWPIQPLLLSGVINELDRSGAWYNPASSGWGISLIEQGETMAGALYAYDTDGSPTWYSGHDSTRSGLNLSVYSGTCPGCIYRAPGTQPAGRLQFAFESETRMTLQPQLNRQTAAGTLTAGVRLNQLGRPASARAADRQLARFSTPSQFKQYLDAGMMRLFPPLTSPSSVSGVTFSSAPLPASTQSGSSTTSVTNVQEAGVDEADWVKIGTGAGGQRIWAYAHDGSSNRLPQLRTALVEPDGTGLRVTGQFPLSAETGKLGRAGLYLTDERLVSVSGTQLAAPALTVLPWPTSSIWRGGVTDIEIFDNATSGVPRKLWHGRLNGYLIASRRIGNQLYVVTRHVPDIAGFNYGSTTTAVRAANQALLASTDVNAMLPAIRINGAAPQPVVAYDRIHVPPQGARGFAADIFTVTAISLSTPAITDSMGVMGLMDTIYASTNALYLAGARNTPIGLLTHFGSSEPANYFTDVHMVRFDQGKLILAGSGSVEGYVDQKGDNAPFRLSEHNGKLRIVTSSSSIWNGQNRNRLTILEPSQTSAGLLKTVSYLPNAQRPQPLGKPGEVLYATRYDGDRLYAVTFRRVDPLYVINLTDPADPVITGELEVVGYSDYLHPLPNGLLLGVGLDARATSTPGDGPFALFQGLQVSLYDVTNPAKPRELQKLTMGQRGTNSALFASHLAFSSLRMADGSLSIGIPAVMHNSGPGLSMASSQIDSITQPWNHTGLLRFSIKGSTVQDARLEQQETLVTHSVTTNTGRPPEAYGRTARSVLFQQGTVYINDGRFWLRDAAGTLHAPQ
jgi:uncharacterized secreted protein with C-terminal beta-propeller domain